MKTDDSKKAADGDEKPKTVKNTALDLQRMKLEKLMKNPVSFKAVGLRIEIRMKPGAIPKFSKVFRPRPVLFALKAAVEKELERLLAEGIFEPIDPATTPVEWASPLVVAPKPNGKIRLCTDFKEKPVVIPDRLKEKKTPHVPDFVRNVMGSSAGAGSGEFHVYRHLRRKEYARQKAIGEKGDRSSLDEAFQMKLLENQKHSEERTAKKRAKRLKKKQNLKKKKIENAKADVKMTDPPSEASASDDSDREELEKDEGSVSDPVESIPV